MIEKDKHGWVFSSQTIHLPRNSPLIGIHHINWRTRAMIASQNPAGDGVHYVVVQSISQKDFERVKNLLTAIDDYSKVAAPSQEEELICFSCDAFRV